MASAQPIVLSRSEAFGGLTPEAGRKRLFRRAIWAAAALSWAYAIALPPVFQLGGWQPAELGPLADWCAVPIQALALLMGGWLTFGRGHLAPAQRRVSWVFLAFTTLNMVASYVWNISRHDIVREELRVPDWLYLADYWTLTAGYAVLFLRAGGTFKSGRVWLDAATMTAVQLVALWSFFLAPSFHQDFGRLISLPATLTYSFTLTAMLTMAALLCLQLPGYRGRYGVLLLVGAGVATVASEIIWLASWQVSYEFIGPYYNYGEVLCFACLISAMACVQYHRPLAAEAANPERQFHNFLPALAVLMTIALISGTLATTKRLDAWVMVGLVALSAQLLITRQTGVLKELRELNQRLASRNADARLTELVRRSIDLILVVDDRGMISFASPAIESVLSLTAGEAQGMPAVTLFGRPHAAYLYRFLDGVTGGTAPAEVIELLVERPQGGLRALKIGASNQLTNPLINGIVLTVHDVTGQRALEREVLDVATRERVRLCADIHDGLGQELAGIALLLHAAAKTPDPDPQRQRLQLEAIVAHVNRTLGAARDLARGYSPLHVVRGSLGDALRRMAHESRAPLRTRLRIDPDFDDRVIGDFAADHLYRIVEEAVTNALRHSGGRHIDIELRSGEGKLLLSIADDGRGMGNRRRDDAGLGLRLMEYRARIVGGTLRTQAGNLGTRIDVTLPLPQTASPRTALSGP